jgi:ATP-dependent Clp protease ATP-binding subunit ClpA
VDFRNTVIIMTSNLGSQYLQRFDPELEAQFEMARIQVLDEVRRSFRPEFLNRIDETVVFRPLTRRQIRAIVDLQLRLLRARLADQKISLDLTDAARDFLAREGYSPDFGARPLRRLIQREVENRLAKMVLGAELRAGQAAVVDYKNGGLTFTIREAVPAAAAE